MPLTRDRIYAFYNRTDYQYYYDFMGETYRFQSDSDYIDAYRLFNSSSSLELFIDVWGTGFQHVYNLTFKSQSVTAVPNRENIYKLQMTWGQPWVFGPTPIKSTVERNFYSLFVGTPDWGMWDVKAWTTNPDNGALDLDGDLKTKQDQYYVQELYESTNSWSESFERLNVHITWDPNKTKYGDEMNINSWMGVQSNSWSSQWNQSYLWYHASDMTMVGSVEMQSIKDMLLNNDEARPGYWGIAWMAQNTTWNDILAQAEAEGWDWIEDEQSWTWLTFAVSQDYGTSYANSTGEYYVGLGMTYEYSGLMLWNDDNNNSVMEISLAENTIGGGELTHFFMPSSVGSVEFTTPGSAFGNYDLEGVMSLDLEEPVTWGVSFFDVNGTLYPYSSYGYWGWYDGVITGTDLQDFDQRPTKTTIDELSFDVNFQGYIDDSGETLNNYAQVKIDNFVGNWNLPRYNERAVKRIFENRSLALNYYADVTMQDSSYTNSWSVHDERDEVASNEPEIIQDSDYFNFLLENSPFAEVILGRDNYTWGCPIAEPYYNVSSHITPYSTFTTAYQSEKVTTGDEQYVSAATWSFLSTQYYVTIGFPEWSGYSVHQDPVFVGYVSSRGTSGDTGSVSFEGLGINADVVEAGESVQVSLNINSVTTINYVELWYRVDGGPWQQIVMSYIGDWYYADIPGHEDGQFIEYFVRAYTNDGTFDSATKHYTVGVPVTTTPTNPFGDGENLGLFVMIGGGVVVILIVAVLVKRRRK